MTDTQDAFFDATAVQDYVLPNISLRAPPLPVIVAEWPAATFEKTQTLSTNAHLFTK